MIEAADLEAAKEIALGLSVGALGPMEIRPVWEREDLMKRRVPAPQQTQHPKPASHAR